MTICSQRLYLCKTLRGQELSRGHINTAFQSLIISRLAYALPAWGGFLTPQHINKMDLFLARAFRFGCTLKQTTLSNILWEADHMLYNCVQNPKHCIHHSWVTAPPPPPRRNCILFSKRLIVSNCHYNIFRDSFINHVEFKDAY